MEGLRIQALEGIPEVAAGTDLVDAIRSASEPLPGLEDGDCVVVTQKIVSKAEDRIVVVDDTPEAKRTLVEQESTRILRRRGDLIISETAHGFVCANAGVDLSNVPLGTAALLPRDSDRSARRIRDGFRARHGLDIAVIISDTFGRPWRLGLTDVAIGVAGIAAVVDLRHTSDATGRELEVTEIAVADEIAGAADLVMGKAANTPVAIVRGLPASWRREGSAARELVRPPSEDLFR